MASDEHLKANDPRIPLTGITPEGHTPLVPKGSSQVQAEMEAFAKQGRIQKHKTLKEYKKAISKVKDDGAAVEYLQAERDKKLAEIKHEYLFDQANVYSENSGTGTLPKDLSDKELNRIVVRAYLPQYSRGEELLSSIGHIAGAGLSLVMLIVGVVFASLSKVPGSFPMANRSLAITGMAIFGLGAVILYTISATYHLLYVNRGKRVLRILDHSSIYVLIASSYTPICLTDFLTINGFPWGYVILGIEWGLGITLIVFNALWLKNPVVKGISIAGYIVLGWGIIFFVPQLIAGLGTIGFALLMTGGILYTLGAILFGMGAKIHYVHGVAHILYVIATILHFLSFLLYVIL